MLIFVNPWPSKQGAMMVGIGAVFKLARFSEAFLVLRAQQSGIPLATVPLVLVADTAPADLRGTAYTNGPFN